jgi:hypothetical protein
VEHPHCRARSPSSSSPAPCCSQTSTPATTVGKQFRHRRIRHRDRIYVEGDTHTQTIEGFFGLFKNGVWGVYHSVSRKWLQGYLNEWAWRYNRRDSRDSMLHDLIAEAVTRTN